MGLEGKKKAKSLKAKLAEGALQGVVLAATVLANPGDTMAGRREATIRSFDSKKSDTIKPVTVAADTPKDDPKDDPKKPKFTIRE